MVYLKERKPKTAEELTEIAKRYGETHGTAGTFSKGGEYFTSLENEADNDGSNKTRDAAKFFKKTIMGKVSLL